MKEKRKLFIKSTTKYRICCSTLICLLCSLQYINALNSFWFCFLRSIRLTFGLSDDETKVRLSLMQNRYVFVRMQTRNSRSAVVRQSLSQIVVRHNTYIAISVWKAYITISYRPVSLTTNIKRRKTNRFQRKIKWLKAGHRIGAQRRKRRETDWKSNSDLSAKSNRCLHRFIVMSSSLSLVS